jgi:hypothetical protein
MEMKELKNKLIAGNITDDECDFLFDELIKKPILDKVPLINIAEYPQLQLLCWNYHIATMTPEDALYRYESCWYLMYEKKLTAQELELINLLQVDRTMYLEFYPYKICIGKRYREKKLYQFISKKL